MGEQTEAYYGNYFAVSLLYQSVHNGAAADDHWFEESIVLIRATGQSESEETADRYARSQEAAYRSATGDAVQWKWLGITGIFAVSDPRFRARWHGRSLFTNAQTAGDSRCFSAAARCRGVSSRRKEAV